MTELDLTHPDHRGLNIESITLYQEIYYLAAIFGASKYISKVYKTDDEVRQYDNFWIFRNIEISEIHRRLISVAVICRNYDDQAYDDDESTNEIRGRVVGVFLNNKSKDLTFREACNKVIHSTWINFDLTDISDIFSGYIQPTLYIYGLKGEEEWKVQLNVDDYIKCAFDIVP